MSFSLKLQSCSSNLGLHCMTASTQPDAFKRAWDCTCVVGRADTRDAQTLVLILTQTKICQFEQRARRAIQQSVFQLYITIDHAQAMTIVQRYYQLLEEPARLVLLAASKR